MRARVATVATILDDAGGALDEGIAIFFPSPHSYTGEAMLELQVHGSPVIARELVRALLACGARLATPGEFTRRAFLNGKIDLHSAAAVADIVDAETKAAARAALANLGGALAEKVHELRGCLSEMLQELAAAIDFPDEVVEPDRGAVFSRLDSIAGALERLRHDGEIGRLMREGLAVAIVGPPNAGKSSLLNALLGADRAIVSELPGTTRDTIEETITIDGVPIRLVDTAGIRTHADQIEAQGIERTQRALSAARIALVVIDGSQPVTPDAAVLLERTAGSDRIVFCNKADLGTAGARELEKAAPIVGSVRYAATLEALRGAIAQLGWAGEVLDVSRPHVVSLREFDAVNGAIEAIAHARNTLIAGDPLDFIASDLQRALSSLGHVSEQVAGEEVIDAIFCRFCIGK